MECKLLPFLGWELVAVDLVANLGEQSRSEERQKHVFKNYTEHTVYAMI